MDAPLFVLVSAASDSAYLRRDRSVSKRVRIASQSGSRPRTMEGFVLVSVTRGIVVST
jgi:hypothetical protein